MRKMYSVMAVLTVMSIIIMASGCSSDNSTREVVLKYIDAAKSRNQEVIENSLDFERLLIAKEGDAYLVMPQQQRSDALAAFKKNMIKSLTSGKSRMFEGFEPKVRNERVSGQEAEVIVYDRKNNNRVYVFFLSRQGASWKIYKISGS